MSTNGFRMPMMTMPPRISGRRGGVEADGRHQPDTDRDQRDEGHDAASASGPYSGSTSPSAARSRRSAMMFQMPTSNNRVASTRG